MIGVIDYGLGNVKAFLNVFKRANVDAAPVRRAADVAAARKLVLPGVGAFDKAMTMFSDSGMRDAVETAALRDKIPLLGICVGMQMLGDSSAEGIGPGLGWIPGRVERLDRASAIRLPHMGWNDIECVPSHLFDGLGSRPRFYFLHSFYFDCANEDHVLARAEYGRRFACAIASGNIYGVQFHPEKSHRFGELLLTNFARTVDA